MEIAHAREEGVFEGQLKMIDMLQKEYEERIPSPSSKYETK